MTSAVVLGLLSALANTVGAVLSRQLALRLPARQLLGPLFGLNALVVLPAVPFVSWTWSWQIAGLHLLSVVLLIGTSLAVWDLFEHGAASATTTAQSLSPVATTIAVAVLLPQTFEPLQGVAAAVVVAGVLAALADAFGNLGRARTVATVLVAAVGTGLVTVMGRLLADQGAGVVEAYFMRTLLAAAVLLVAVPPRDIPLRELPQLGLRAFFISLHFVLILIGVQRGSPAVVQTFVATAPLFAHGFESLRDRRAPPPRLVTAALLTLAGVALVLFGGM